MSKNSEEKPPIWGAFCSALGTEYREAKEISGASGLVHPVEAIGVDDKGKRLVLVSSEHNPRISALMRGDVQATMPGMKVMVARPLAIDLAYAAKKMFFTEEGTIDVSKLLQVASILQMEDEKKEDMFKELFGEPASQLIMSVYLSSLPAKTHILNVVEQFGFLDWSKVAKPKDSNFIQTATDLLTQFSNMDNLAGDREQGICPVPTYELTESDWDLFHQNKHVDEIQARLRDLDIYQYFFPPADSLALGLIDRGLATEGEVLDGFELAQTQGHQLSENAIVPDVDGLFEIVEALKANGYAIEGEFSTELTDQGRAVRKVVNIRPSEGLIAKISRVMSVKVDLNLKDLLGPK
ncbi:hypothetical protein GS634_08165 [Ruegeria atlantica]|uniref:Uncharacterized protein n=1 Tax=Ruegeria atlantica TaxID=81569 RepID=A0AA90Z1J8_9RHOB|nr:hypothetical protein [Ruegeria atlantica]NOE18097.1 hypothetical protein [Ruegeria atlantica]